MSLPYLIRFVKSANNRCNFCFKIVVQVTVFFQRRFKWAVRANFCALQRCTFPTRVFTSFWTCLLSATVLRQTFFQTCGASYRVFQLRFKRKVRANFCALQRCTFPTRVFTSFWTCLLSATVLRQTLLRNLLPVAKNMKLHEKNRKKISQTVDSFWRLIYNVKAVEVRV